VKQCTTAGLVRAKYGFKDGGEVVVGVALVQEQRLAAVHGQLQLALESAALRVAWCEVAEVVQPAFANGHDFRLCQQLAKLGDGFVGHLKRVVRMHAVRGEQPAEMRAQGPAPASRLPAWRR